MFLSQQKRLVAQKQATRVLETTLKQCITQTFSFLKNLTNTQIRYKQYKTRILYMKSSTVVAEL